MANQRGLDDICKVWEIKTLKKMPDEPRALALLQKVAHQVQPILRRRKWKVPLLSEFFPKNAQLLGLNVNAGAEIRIRLRHARSKLSFYPFESVLGTMLHEMAHIIQGPHDAKFYAILDELTKECEELMAKGIAGTGEGFDVAGHRVDGGRRNPDMNIAREKALRAAEKRLRTTSLMGSGRIGGRVDVMATKTPAEAAAWAAERRLRDDMWCEAQQSGTIANWACPRCTLINGKSDRVCAACDAPKETSIVEEEEEVVIVKEIRPRPIVSKAAQEAAQAAEQRYQSAVKRKPTRVQQSTRKRLSPSTWKCGICTLENSIQDRRCTACNTVRHGICWTCSKCTYVNMVKKDECEMCKSQKSIEMYLF